MKKFLIFELNNICYSSYLYFADSIAKQLNNMGYEVDIFHGTDSNLDELEHYLGKSYTACLDFNSILPKMILEDDTCFLDNIDAPFYDFILDHPLYHHDSLKRKLKNFHVFCLDDNHKKYIETYYPHIKSVHVLPMTGESHDFTEKSIDLLFTGSYINPKDIENIIAKEPSFIRNDISFLIDQMLTNPGMTQDEALQLLMKDSDSINKDNFHIFMNNYFLADTYVRAYLREEIINTLVCADISLTICGDGWKKFNHKDKQNLKILPSVPFHKTFSFMARSKIVLNIMPLFKSGSHDRIFSAMLNKCVCLTDSSTYLLETFKNEENIIFYDMKYIKDLPELVTNSLHNPINMSLISENGYREAITNHTWKQRVQIMLDEMNL